jgi:hypothetical protein
MTIILQQLSIFLGLMLRKETFWAEHSGMTGVGGERGGWGKKLIRYQLYGSLFM